MKKGGLQNFADDDSLDEIEVADAFATEAEGGLVAAGGGVEPEAGGDFPVGADVAHSGVFAGHEEVDLAGENGALGVDAAKGDDGAGGDVGGHVVAGAEGGEVAVVDAGDGEVAVGLGGGEEGGVGGEAKGVERVKGDASGGGVGTGREGKAGEVGAGAVAGQEPRAVENGVATDDPVGEVFADPIAVAFDLVEVLAPFQAYGKGEGVGRQAGPPDDLFEPLPVGHGAGGLNVTALCCKVAS